MTHVAELDVLFRFMFFLEALLKSLSLNVSGHGGHESPSIAGWRLNFRLEPNGNA